MKPANDERELTRLLNEDASGLTEHVASLREHVPSALELGALASGLAARGIGVTPVATNATPLAWKKWAAGGAGGAAAIALWLALTPRDAGSAAARVTPAQMRNELAAQPTVAAPMSRGDQAERRLATLTEESVEPAPSAAAAPSTSSATSVTEAPALSPEANPQPLAAAAHTSQARAARVAETTPLANEATLPPTELELLRDARLAIRSSPAAALGLVDRHAQLYPQGKLTQERELIAISALVAMGRRTAALSRAASFERSFPGSAYRKQVEELLR